MFAVAPMMDWTDRHCRRFHRQLSARARLYSEMVTADAVVFGDRGRLLGFSAEEGAVALQLGGSNPSRLAEAARIGEGFGYDEINLNVGCPSDRVQSGRFGACLMAEPALVAECIAAMRAAVFLPVTVKCRLGIDDQPAEETLPRFIETVASAGAKVFIVHARKAWLKGLSPKENREVPPLDYALVRAMKAAFPGLSIVLNGGIASLGEAKAHLQWADGVMLGRAAYQTPALLLGVDPGLFGTPAPYADERAAVEGFLPYVASELEKGTPLIAITRHMLGLFQGVPGAKAWRRHLSEGARAPGAGLEVIEAALGRLGRSAGEADLVRQPEPVGAS